MKKNYLTSLKSNFLFTLGLLLFMLIGNSVTTSAQIVKSFTQRTSQSTPTKKIYNVKGDFTLLGNTNLTLQNYSNNGGNNAQMVYVDIDGNNNTFNSSSAELILSQENGADPSCSNVVYAGLYWTGRAHNPNSWENSPMSFSVTKNGVTKTLDKKKVSIKGPNAGSYSSVTANINDIYYPTTSHGVMYSAYAEVTDYVKQHGVGNYTVADLALREGNGGSTGYYGGWAMVVVYENSKMSRRDVTIFDGHAYVAGNITDSYELPVSGFNAIQNGPVNVKLGLIAGEGDRNISGDYFEMWDQNANQFVRLNHSGNSTNNFFNSSIYTGGNARNPNLLNNTGMDISMFELNNTNKNFITNGQTSTRFKYGTTQDTYIIPFIAMAIDAYIPEPEGIDHVITINGQPAGPNPTILPGQELEVTVDIRNIGDEAINNAVVKVPIPFASEFVSASGAYFQGLSGPQPVFAANEGANGSILWNFGHMPVIAGQPILGTLTYKLKATTDCLILSTAGCALNIPIGGEMSGVGAISQVSFDEYPLIQGYETIGSCIGEPITDPILVAIDGEEYVLEHCQGIEPVQHFTFCNIEGSNIPFTDFSGFFPAGSRFYNEFPITSSTIEYTIATGFPATVGISTYYAVPPNSETCAFKFTIEVTEIDSVPTVEDADYCVGDSGLPLVATPSSPNLILYFFTQATGGTAHTSLVPDTSIAGVFTYYVAEGVSPQCMGERVPFTVRVHELPEAPICVGDIEECATSPIQTLNANDAIAQPAGFELVWFDALIDGNIIADPILNSIGSITYYAQLINETTGCGSKDRTAVTLTITEALDAPISGGDITECEIDPTQILTAVATVPAGQTVVWYDAATGGNIVTDPILDAVGSVTYYAQAEVVDGDCGSIERTAVTLTITEAPDAPISGGDITECEMDPTQTLTAVATVPAGQTVVWYDAATGGNIVTDPILDAVGSITYYAQAEIDGEDCGSTERTAVTLTITEAPDAPISGGDITECEMYPIQTLTAVATVPAGQTVVWYDAATGGNVVTDPILDAVGSITYYAQAEIDGEDCGSTNRTAVTLTITDAPDAPISGGDITECEMDPIQTLTAVATVPAGQTVVWYDAATGGNIVTDPILDAVGSITYYAQAEIDGEDCGSTERTAVTLTITDAPDAPISGGDITECEMNPIQTLTAVATVPAGQSVVWYDAATGGNIVIEPILDAVGSITYYAQAEIDGEDCGSTERTAVTLTITEALDAPISGGDITECVMDPIQTLTAVATVPAGQTVVWYDAAVGGNIVTDPILDAVGSITYYAQAEIDGGGCGSLERTAITLTLNNCSISIEKIADPNNPNGCTPLAVGETINYTIYVTNNGNVGIENVVVNDPLIDPNNPIPGPDSGDTNNNGILDPSEVWVYTGTYTVQAGDILNGSVVNTATVTGDVSIPSLSPYTVEASTSVTVYLCQEAAISITKASSSDTGSCISLNVNDTVDYTFTVTNEGDVDIEDVVLTDIRLGGILAGPVSGDSNNDGILNVGEVWLYEATYTITQDDINDGYVINTAEVDGNTSLGTVNDTSNTVTIDICQDAAIAIVKTHDQTPGTGDCISISVGETITYTFTVTNEGNVSLSAIDVVDPLPGLSAVAFVSGDTNNDGILDLDETWIYTATYIVTQVDIDLGTITNQATATGTAPDNSIVIDLSGSSVDNDDQTIIDICQDAAIAIVKTHDQTPGTGDCISISVGETITYTFTVTNEGNVSLSAIDVVDPLPGLSAVTFVSGDTNNDGILDLDETWIYTATYIVTQVDIDLGMITNQATATGTAPDNSIVTDLSGSSVDNDDQTIIDICQDAAIAIVKTHDQTPGTGDCISISVGETITYTFTVTNEGNVSLSAIAVVDPLPGLSAVTFVSGDANNDGILDLDETWIYTATYIVTQVDIDLGTITNQATATGTAPDNSTVTDLSGSSVGNDDQTIIDICQDAAIAIVKTHDQTPGTGDCVNLNVGETVTYTFTVTNEGNVSLSAIAVVDPLPGLSAVTFVSGDTNNDGILDLDETWIYTATYIVTQVDIDLGTITNQATATGTAPDNSTVTDLSGSSVDNDDQTIIDICQDAAIAIVKTHDQTPGTGDCINLNVGETITYTFTVTNEGNVSLSAIAVVDPLPGLSAVAFVSGDTNNDGILDLDETWIYTATYIVTQVDIDLGTITNQATATGTAPDNSTVTDLSGSSVDNDDQTIIEICQDGFIGLIKEGVVMDENGNGCADPGETIVYSFRVANMGNVELIDVIVTDPLVTVIGGPITLDIGEIDTTSFTAVYTITQSDIDNGFVENQALVVGTSPDGVIVSDLSDGNSYLEDNPTITTLCQSASITLEKFGEFNDDNGNGASEVGETISYNFTVTNTGNVSLYDVMITDPLPGIVINGGPIAVLLPGESDSTTFTATYAITQGDIDNREVYNLALVTGYDINDEAVTDESDVTVILPGVLDITDFEIFNGITPDGDGLNDYFQVVGIQEFPDNNVKIYNRWGVLVFERDGYGGRTGQENVFRGISEGRATVEKNKELPTGTYFYVITFPTNNPGKSSYSGYLYINR